MYKILRRKQLNDTVVRLDVEAPFIAKKAKAGQFIILRIDERGERMPLTIADTNAEEGSVSIIFQIVGQTTMLLSQMKEGDFLLDFVGPLGAATEFGDIKKACVIGGGVLFHPVRFSLTALIAFLLFYAPCVHKDLLSFLSGIVPFFDPKVRYSMSFCLAHLPPYCDSLLRKHTRHLSAFFAPVLCASFLRWHQKADALH